MTGMCIVYDKKQRNLIHTIWGLRKCLRGDDIKLYLKGLVRQGKWRWDWIRAHQTEGRERDVHW